MPVPTFDHANFVASVVWCNSITVVFVVTITILVAIVATITTIALVSIFFAKRKR